MLIPWYDISHVLIISKRVCPLFIIMYCRYYPIMTCFFWSSQSRISFAFAYCLHLQANTNFKTLAFSDCS